MAQKFNIPDCVIHGLKAVRASAKTNMLDRPVVLAMLQQINPDAYRWLDTHPDQFMEALIQMGSKLGVNE